MDHEIVRAQIEGVEIAPAKPVEFVSVPLPTMIRLRSDINEAISKFDGALELVAPGENGEANFGFYVDGYTLRGTPVIGEILVTSADGRQCLLKSSSLTAFLERRLEPNVFPEDKPKG